MMDSKFGDVAMEKAGEDKTETVLKDLYLDPV